MGQQRKKLAYSTCTCTRWYSGMGWRGGIAAQTMGPWDIPWVSHVPDLDVTVGWDRQVDIPWEYEVYQWDGVDR